MISGIIVWLLAALLLALMEDDSPYKWWATYALCLLWPFYLVLGIINKLWRR